MPRGQKAVSKEADELCNCMRFKVLFIIWTSVFCLAVNNCCVSSDSDKITEGLKKWEKAIPLPYHEGLDKTVNLYDKSPFSDNFLTYSAFIDSALIERNMPMELRYLPLALSGMRRNYCEGDRCGAWQLPTLTALRYGLDIDENQDERFDVKASTRAALDCLNELYQHYGDWWYSILAYSNSPVALQHTLKRQSETPQLWDFSEDNLLPNTKIIGDFIACVYLGNEGRLKFAKIADPEIKREPVKKPVADSTVAETKAPESAVSEVNQRVEGPTKTTVANNTKKTGSSTKPGNGATQKTQKYKIKKGDTLTKIASKYHVKVNDLMKWNNLKSDRIREGQTLIIKK